VTTGRRRRRVQIEEQAVEGSGPKWKEAAACPNRGTSCGGLRPQVEACNKTSTYGRNDPMSEQRRGTMEF